MQPAKAVTEITGTEWKNRLENGGRELCNFSGYHIRVSKGELTKWWHPTNRWTNYNNAIISGTIDGARLPGEFEGARITAIFDDCHMQHVSFNGSTLEEAVFRGCKLCFSTFKGSKLKGCVFDRSVARGANFRFASFDKCNIVNSDLGGAIMSSISTSNCNWTNTSISGTILQDADLTGVTVFEAKFPDRARYRQTKMPDGTLKTSKWLSQPEFYEAYLKGQRNFDNFNFQFIAITPGWDDGLLSHPVENATFRSCYFTSSQFGIQSRTVWRKCIFSNSYFDNTRWSSTDLISECDFSNCVFQNAIFQRAKFENCKFDHCDFTNAKFNICSFESCSFDGANWNPNQYASKGMISTVDEKHLPDFDSLTCPLP